MKQIQKDILLTSYALAEIQRQHGIKAEDTIPDYDKDKAAKLFDKHFPRNPSLDELKELAIGGYKKLKIKKNKKY